MYINLGDILGLLLGRLNKSCRMFSTLVCFLKFFTSVIACIFKQCGLITEDNGKKFC